MPQKFSIPSRSFIGALNIYLFINYLLEQVFFWILYVGTFCPTGIYIKFALYLLQNSANWALKFFFFYLWDSLNSYQKSLLECAVQQLIDLVAGRFYLPPSDTILPLMKMFQPCLKTKYDEQNLGTPLVRPISLFVYLTMKFKSLTKL